MLLRYLKNGTIIETTDSNDDIEITVTVEGSLHRYEAKARTEITLKSFTERTGWKVSRGDLYFWNGYQSWTATKQKHYFSAERDVRNIPAPIRNQYKLTQYGDSHIYDYSANRNHGFDFFYELGKEKHYAYSTNLENAFLIFELNKLRRTIFIRSDVEGKTIKAGESYILASWKEFTDENEAKASFETDFPEKKLKKLFGYCSWYNYYQDISEEIILRDLEGLDSRFNLFQVDDGYETFVGDWLDVDEKKFPNGLEPVAKKIIEKGYKAGIWLAPLVAETKSKIYQEHPEFFKKNSKGEMVAAGSNWSGFYCLDLENEEVWAYIEKCLKHYKGMGFDFFKLDFLYAASLPSYQGKTRAEMADYAYKRLRAILGDSLILGCGATLGQAAYAFDYLRIGPDVSLEFNDVWYMKYMHRERISTKVTLQNTIYRSFMNRHLFGNDPDVFLLRDNNIKLSKEQKEALIIIDSLFGQVLLTSDDLLDYDDEKKALLAKALDLFERAEKQSFVRLGDYIVIKYELDGEMNKLVYNTKKGVFTHGR